MSFLASQPWIAVALPLVLAAIGVALPERAGRWYAWLAMTGPAVVTLCGLAVLGAAGEPEAAIPPAAWGRPPVTAHVTWLFQDDAVIRIGYAVDGLSAVMLLVAGVVALMVMLFSVGYMHGEDGYKRYFSTLSLFTAAMAGLVIAADLVGLFIAWEVVGLCSYLLIGFWWRKPSASAASLKAFMTTRVGDAGLLLALAVLWASAGTLSFEGIATARLTAPVAAVAALLVFVGAAGKSAQFPLHIWLPDAMEGPTPVSALIHAATMVAAGVYLVARMGFLFAAAPAAGWAVLVVGAFTAFMAATVAVTQTDIKKVLAYSTISQLGFMFAALGAGAAAAAMFHLVTHAAFKALLFLASGSVIHGSGTQDLREMGGLAKKMPYTMAAWVTGALALIGIPPLAGFFSKEEILHSVRDMPLAWGVLAFTALITAFYTARATRLAFFGAPRSAAHPHESPWTMVVPLGVLSVGAAVLGLVGGLVLQALEGAEEVHGVLPPVELTPDAVLVVVFAVAAAALGGWLYAKGPARDESFEAATGSAWRGVRAAYGFDDAVMRVVVAGTVAVARNAYEAIDRSVIDAAVEGVGRAARGLGRALSRIQDGDGQRYAAMITAGVVALVLLSALAGR